MAPDSTDQDLDSDLASMARCAEHLIERLATFEPSAEFGNLRNALNLMRGYLSGLVQGESTIEEKQRAHARALRVFEGMRDYLEKLEISEVKPQGQKIH